MKRKIINIDREKCNGCGLCIPNCHEGALQMIDGKATLVSELMCDGLGACLGHCPEGAITIEEREAEPYNETNVMELISSYGKNTVLAHLIHLLEHEQMDFLKEGATYLKENKEKMNFSVDEVIDEIHIHFNKIKAKKEQKATEQLAETEHNHHHQHQHHHSGAGHHQGGSCPGSAVRSLRPETNQLANEKGQANKIASQLENWPIQMHLINPNAPYFKESNLLLAADCVAFSYGNFHNEFLHNKKLIIACPKLDSNREIYVEKLITLIQEAKIKSINVLKMEVPCCSGLLSIAEKAKELAGSDIPVNSITISIDGKIL